MKYCWPLMVMRIFYLQTAKVDIMKQLFFWPLAMIGIFHLQTAKGTYCADNIYLRVGTRGVISCNFGEFDVVGWLKPTQHLDTTPPFIYLEGSEISGPESTSGEYSMFPNGSLVITNVSLDHEKNYTVRIVTNGASLVHIEVCVKVYVLPNPKYPVVDGQTDQQRVIVHSSNGDASFNCTMDHIRPAVLLEAVFIPPTSGRVPMTMVPSRLSNSDGTYNVSLHVQLRAINQLSGAYFMECRAVHSFAHLTTLEAAEITTLLVHDQQHIFPSVNGLDSQQHVVLDVKREGTLNCSLGRVPSNVELEWNYIRRDSSRRVALENHRHYSSNNGDGTYNITSIITYKATSDSIQCVTLKCGLSDSAFHFYTTVELNFPAADQQHILPSVNGLDSQQHVVLDVKREGTLNCSLGRVPSNVELEWNYIKHDSSRRVALENHRHYSSNNGDGTYNITSIITYKATSDSIQCVTLKCGLSDSAFHFYTTVELNFPAADPDSTSDTSHSNQHVILFAVVLVAVLTMVLFFSYICCTIKSSKLTQENLQPQTRQHAQESEDFLSL